LTLVYSYTEHDFNASTFAARVTTSARRDFYSYITSAIGTLKADLHGKQMKLLYIF
jgi:citrate synthase